MVRCRPPKTRLAALCGLAAILATTATVPAQDPAATAAPERRSRLQGSVLEGRRDPLLGAAVLVRPAADAGRAWLTTTGERGAFRIDGLPDGAYLVTIARNGFVPVVKPSIELRYPFRAVVEVTLQRGAEGADLDDSFPAGDGDVDAHGVVVDPDGRPLADVRLRLVHAGGTHDPRSRRTGDDGRFAFEGLPAGSWRVEAEGVGTLDVRKLVAFVEDTELTIVLVPQPADYEPSPLELMPPERPIPPPGFAARGNARTGS